MVSSIQDLPASNSPTLALVQPTQEEKIATWHRNGESWRGTFALPTYIRREIHLENQAFTRDGGITFWILVDTKSPSNARLILASCESLRKRALISKDGSRVEDITSHGVGSVFCDPAYRGRGYAQRMITELGKKLDTHMQEEGKKAYFTVLFSDIGKKFYSRMGWEAFPSSHIALPPSASRNDASTITATKTLLASELAEFCDLDERWLRSSMASCADSNSICVALIPDLMTMQWHHAREEFACMELLGRDPDVKGAYAKTSSGEQVWCIWTRTFGSTADGNTLNILRFVIEGEQVAHQSEYDSIASDATYKERVQAGAAVLRAAQLEASKWEMGEVQLWNPTPLTILAVREIDSNNQVLQRDEESIASLRWHGVDSDRSKVQWVENEKYGWC